MNWLEEVRATLRGMNVKASEQDGLVVVTLGPVWLRLTDLRVMCVECQERGMLTRAMRSKLELIEDSLAARGWVAL